MTRKDFLAAVAGVAATLAASGVALATTTPSTQPPTQKPPGRGEYRSAKNIKHVRQALERLIDELQHDKRDYGGWRVKAIASLQLARGDLDSALQWDSSHPAK